MNNLIKFLIEKFCSQRAIWHTSCFFLTVGKKIPHFVDFHAVFDCLLFPNKKSHRAEFHYQSNYSFQILTIFQIAFWLNFNEFFPTLISFDMKDLVFSTSLHGQRLLKFSFTFVHKRSYKISQIKHLFLSWLYPNITSETVQNTLSRW